MEWIQLQCSRSCHFNQSYRFQCHWRAAVHHEWGWSHVICQSTCRLSSQWLCGASWPSDLFSLFGAHDRNKCPSMGSRDHFPLWHHSQNLGCHCPALLQFGVVLVLYGVPTLRIDTPVVWVSLCFIGFIGIQLIDLLSPLACTMQPKLHSSLIAVVGRWLNVVGKIRRMDHRWILGSLPNSAVDSAVEKLLAVLVTQLLLAGDILLVNVGGRDLLVWCCSKSVYYWNVSVTATVLLDVMDLSGVSLVADSCVLQDTFLWNSMGMHTCSVCLSNSFLPLHFCSHLLHCFLLYSAEWAVRPRQYMQVGFRHSGQGLTYQ